jgi:hypothetical protein
LTPTIADQRSYVSSTVVRTADRRVHEQLGPAEVGGDPVHRGLTAAGIRDVDAVGARATAPLTDLGRRLGGVDVEIDGGNGRARPEGDGQARSSPSRPRSRPRRGP